MKSSIWEQYTFQTDWNHLKIIPHYWELGTQKYKSTDKLKMQSKGTQIAIAVTNTDTGNMVIILVSSVQRR